MLSNACMKSMKFLLCRALFLSKYSYLITNSWPAVPLPWHNPICFYDSILLTVSLVFVTKLLKKRSLNVSVYIEYRLYDFGMVLYLLV